MHVWSKQIFKTLASYIVGLDLLAFDGRANLCQEGSMGDSVFRKVDSTSSATFFKLDKETKFLWTKLEIP